MGVREGGGGRREGGRKRKMGEKINIIHIHAHAGYLACKNISIFKHVRFCNIVVNLSYGYPCAQMQVSVGCGSETLLLYIYSCCLCVSVTSPSGALTLSWLLVPAVECFSLMYRNTQEGISAIER